MKIDMHTHCLPVSRCAHHTAEQLPEIFKAAGLDAVVLTNHCSPHHCDSLSADPSEQAKIFVETYHRAREAGERVGVRVLFGVEVKLINEPAKPEFLLYGISEQTFLSSYPLYNLTQKELYDFCNQNDIIMVQSHPFRSEQGYLPSDMRFVHGIEIYNAHPNFNPRFEEAESLAREHSKIMTAGSDCHVKEQAGSAGMIFLSGIADQFKLRDRIKSGRQIIFSRNGEIYTT